MFKKEPSFTNLRDLWTQGGRLTGPEIDRGLELIDELWSLLYFTPDGLPADEELKNRDSESETIITYLEIKPGAAQPTPNPYLETGKFEPNDLEIAKRIAN